MKVDADEVARINERMLDMGSVGPFGVPYTHVEHKWDIAWLSRCVDPECVARHHFELELGYVRYLGNDPVCALSIGMDKESVLVPLTKARLAELINDLRELLDVLP